MYRPQIDPETIAARIEGLPLLWAQGISAELLWCYAATGNIRPQGIVAREMAAAIADFRKHCRHQQDRDKVMGECLQRLKLWLTGVS